MRLDKDSPSMMILADRKTMAVIVILEKLISKKEEVLVGK